MHKDNSICLNTLTVHEIMQNFPGTKMDEILFKGGWPELYADEDISPVPYLNGCITHIEKEIVASGGVQKLSEFNASLRLLAARTGQLLDFSHIAQHSRVSALTIKKWVSLLERVNLIYLLKPYFSDQGKRLIKTPKLYFLDVGLAVRLQGWQEAGSLLNSLQINAIFETLVLSEIVKFIRNDKKNWHLFFWRTKEGSEIDFVLKTSESTAHPFEVKLAIQNLPSRVEYPLTFQKQGLANQPLILVTYGGKAKKLPKNCLAVLVAELYDYLKTL